MRRIVGSVPDGAYSAAILEQPRKLYRLFCTSYITMIYGGLEFG